MFEDALLLTRMTSHRDLDALSLILIVLSLSLSLSLPLSLEWLWGVGSLVSETIVAIW